MTDAKIRQVLDRYEQMVTEQNQRLPPDLRPVDQLHHLLTMIPKMRDMLDAINRDRGHLPLPTTATRPLQREKLMRWLGFLQGALWTKGMYTIDELRAHNMPDDEAFRDRDS